MMKSLLLSLACTLVLCEKPILQQQQQGFGLSIFDSFEMLSGIIVTLVGVEIGDGEELEQCAIGTDNLIYDMEYMLSQYKQMGVIGVAQGVIKTTELIQRLPAMIKECVEYMEARQVLEKFIRDRYHGAQGQGLNPVISKNMFGDNHSLSPVFYKMQTAFGQIREKEYYRAGLNIGYIVERLTKPLLNNERE